MDEGKLEIIGMSLLDDVRVRRQKASSTGVSESPRTRVEQALCAITADVLGLERVGIQDDFIALGGDSLDALQIAARIRDEFGVDLPLSDLFEFRTLARVAPKIQAAIEQPLSQPPPLVRAARTENLPLSFSQERMWFIHQLAPAGAAYHVTANLYLEGPLDEAALRSSVEKIVARHEALRTRFPAVDGQPTQIIAEHADSPITLVSLEDVPANERDTRLMELAQRDLRRPFDLERGPLFRVTVYRLHQEAHLILTVMHHIISDAWSLGVLARELVTLYNAAVRGETAALSELLIQPADFAVWERTWLRGAALEAELAYWREHLRGVNVLELPTDHPRPPLQTYRGARYTLALTRSQYDALWNLSESEDVTPAIALLALFKVLLSRYAGQEDVAVGISVANRKWLKTEELVSAFVNTLVVRTDLSGDPTVRELLAREREVALNAYAHQDMPFAKLVAELNPERHINQAPLVQVMYNFINVPVPELALEALETKLVMIEAGGAQFDLALTATDLPILRQLSLEYNTDLFESATIQRMLGHLLNLLAAAYRNPAAKLSELRMLSDAEARELLVERNATESVYPNSDLAALFEQQVARTPAATALFYGDEKISFGELNAQANQLARYLQVRGVGRKAIVGICMDRAPEMVTALLGSLKAGAAFLPMNPGFPDERLLRMLQETGALFMLTKEHLAGRFAEAKTDAICLDRDWAEIARESAENLAHATTLDDAAYVIYTSGSTGVPKGVVGTHRGIVNTLAWFGSNYPFEAGEVSCMRTPLNFVDSIREIFGPLLAGVSGVILPEEAIQDPHVLVEQLAKYAVTRIALVPSVLRVLLEMRTPLREQLLKVKSWFVGGEALTSELCSEFHSKRSDCVLVNLYGCSEAAGDSLYFDTRDFDGGAVPIGRPLANTQVFVLDAHRRPVPNGVTGELYIGGAGVAQGYLNQPDLTREKFVPNPFHALKPNSFSTTLYRTGDLASYLPDGNIRHLGRRDQQVKVRGIRVEVAEVELALRQHDAVLEAVVIAREDLSQNQRLIGYIVPRQGIQVKASELRHFLQTRVPSYMIPSAFVMMETLPLNSSGKVDRKALPPPDERHREAGHTAAVPTSNLERQVREIWERVLGAKPIGVRDDFFEIGGHSLLAVRLFAEIESELGARLPLTTLFQTPTIEGLALELQARNVQARALPPRWSPLVPIQAQGSNLPFFCVHGLGGGVLDYTRLSQLLGREQPFYGLQACGNEQDQTPDSTLQAMAARYIVAMREVQPQGPYRIGGYSYGGTVAFEMARQLEAAGERTALLAVFDQAAPHSDYRRVRLNRQFANGFVRNFPMWLRDYWELDAANKRGRFARVARARIAHSGNDKPGARDLRMMVDDVAGIPQARQTLIQVHLDALIRYMSQPIAGRVTVFRAERQPLWCSFDPQLGWGTLALGGVEVRPIAGFHRNLLREPWVQSLAQELERALRAEG